MSHPPPPSSKLFIRSEVLAVVEYLSVVTAPSKQDRTKQIKRLSGIEDRKTVLDILLKELQRTSSAGALQTVSELLMELGTIDALQAPLWTLIRQPDARDEVKDAANLILRHLGDETDPDLYLEYLEDPQGLINRETERMLEVAARNPEALIDFIDFIFSLPVGEQANLLNSLQADYSPDHLLNIYIPTFLAEPPEEIRDLVLRNLGKIRSKRAAIFLEDMKALYTAEEPLGRDIRRVINELRLAGVYREDLLDAYRLELAKPHPLLEESDVYKCYVTLTDGIGNQGIVVSRKQRNGDITMTSVAINDLHGIIDCFGFYQLSEADFNKISDKFHEESCKITASPGYCRARLEAAEALALRNRTRVPYEYSCWKVILGDLPQERIDPLDVCRKIARPEWVVQCENLYRHPDFETWFLEEGDHPVVTEVLADVAQTARRIAAEGASPETFLKIADRYALGLAMALMTTEWREILIARLADSAYLLNAQDTRTFAALAATEVMKLIAYEPEDEEKILNVGFIRQFGRRCVEEQFLRLKQDPEAPEALGPLVDHVVSAWAVE